MTQPRRYVPESLGEVSDFIGAMVIAIPNLVDRISDGGVDGAFATFAECLPLARKRLGEDLSDKILEMAAASHALFKVGETREGRKLLLEIDKLFHAGLGGQKVG